MEKNTLVFGKMNYILMVAGIIIVMIGFFIMTLDKEEYGAGTLGLTVGPVVATLGFVVEFFAIFYKSKK